MDPTDRSIHPGWLLDSAPTTEPQTAAEHPTSQASVASESDRTTSDDADLPSLKVPTAPEAKAAFENYLFQKYGSEAEDVLERVPLPNRLPFCYPDDRKATAAVEKHSQCRVISKLRSDWILERQREKEKRQKASRVGIFSIGHVEPEESPFYGRPYRSWKGSSNLWTFGDPFINSLMWQVDFQDPEIVAASAFGNGKRSLIGDTFPDVL